jgi:hypothetical protein
VPLRCDEEQAWRKLAGWRARYGRQLLTMAALFDAVPTPWLAQAQFVQYRPPLRAIGRADDDERTTRRAAGPHLPTIWAEGPGCRYARAAGRIGGVFWALASRRVAGEQSDGMHLPGQSEVVNVLTGTSGLTGAAGEPTGAGKAGSRNFPGGAQRCANPPDDWRLTTW